MKSRSKFKFWIIAVFLAVIFTLFNLFGFSNDIKNFFFLLSSPFQKTFWQAGKKTSDFAAGILEFGRLKEETDALRLERRTLVSRIVALLELKKENEIMREALEVGLKEDFELMLSRAVNKDVSQDSILVDKGSADGAFKGSPVITEQRVVLGRLGQVYDNFSEVILISSKESSFDAKIVNIEDGNEVYGIVKGKGGSRLYFDLIPKEDEIFEKDAIVTSALGGIYPAGLLVGEIESIEKTDTDPFQQAEIRPAFDIGNLDYLFIVTKW